MAHSLSDRVCRGTIDDCELVEGLVLTQRVANSGLSRVEKAKIGLIQFCLSPPKTDVSPKRPFMLSVAAVLFTPRPAATS